MKFLKEREQIFLSKLSVIDYKYKTLDKSKEQFNIFTALHKENDEVRLYSRFISVLLSPESRHKRNDLFLKLFLQVLSIDDFDISQCKVYPTEYDKSEYNEIDILIINRISKQAIIVENKIGAGDSNHEDRGQLEGYYDLIYNKDNIPKENIRVYYLTPDRRNPSDESLGKYKTLENINGATIDYEHEIQNWLNRCLQECINNPYLRESILQFVDLIKHMTNNDSNIEERLEIRDLIANSADNMESAKLLVENFKHIKWHTAWDFWNELADSLRRENFEINQQPTEENITNTTHYETYKKSYSASNDYGLYFTSTKGLRIYIWNGVDDYWIYWGMNKIDILNDLTSLVNGYIKANPNYFKSSETSYWRYFDLKHEENIFFPDFSYQGTFNLIDKKYRTKIIEERLIPEIKKFLEQL
ncbi:MAG: PD-(D/E)XK nuclease family protein [Dysgonomonas sp.]